MQKMPITDPIKILEYVKKLQIKKKDALGAEAYNKINADAEQTHRRKFKATMEQINIKNNKWNI